MHLPFKSYLALTSPNIKSSTLNIYSLVLLIHKNQNQKQFKNFNPNELILRVVRITNRYKIEKSQNIQIHKNISII